MLRHPRHTLDHGAWHPGNAADEDSTAGADTEHCCNRENRLVIRRENRTLQTKTGAALCRILQTAAGSNNNERRGAV